MKISAIVPVYNSEKYVSRCIESILAQTYTNWELILVDDGSKDNSLELLKSYMKKDSRIKVFHQENAGAGAARNVGIDNAIGDYIVFVDSDDIIENDYFMLLSKQMSDVVFIDVNQRDEKYNISFVEKMSLNSNLSKDDILRNQMTGKQPWGGWRKAIKSYLIKDNEIYYSCHTVGEEAVFSFWVLYFAKNISFIDKAVYNYVYRRDSLSRTLLDDPWGAVAMNLKDEIVKRNLYDIYADTINAFVMTATAVSLNNLAKKYSLTDYIRLSKQRIKRMKKELDFSYKIDFAHMDKKALLLYPMINSGFVLPIYFISRFRKK